MTNTPINELSRALNYSEAECRELKVTNANLRREVDRLYSINLRARDTIRALTTELAEKTRQLAAQSPPLARYQGNEYVPMYRDKDES